MATGCHGRRDTARQRQEASSSAVVDGRERERDGERERERTRERRRGAEDKTKLTVGSCLRRFLLTAVSAFSPERRRWEDERMRGWWQLVLVGKCLSCCDCRWVQTYLFLCDEWRLSAARWVQLTATWRMSECLLVSTGVYWCLLVSTGVYWCLAFSYLFNMLKNGSIHFSFSYFIL